jgi:hypothetical protein
MNETNVGYALNWRYTDRANETMHAEGVQDHSVQTAPFPALPVAGDLISWDWLAGGQPFKVMSRAFIYSDPRTIAVELTVGLADE